MSSCPLCLCFTLPRNLDMVSFYGLCEAAIVEVNKKKYDPKTTMKTKKTPSIEVGHTERKCPH